MVYSNRVSLIVQLGYLSTSIFKQVKLLMKKILVPAQPVLERLENAQSCTTLHQYMKLISQRFPVPPQRQPPAK